MLLATVHKMLGKIFTIHKFLLAQIRKMLRNMSLKFYTTNLEKDFQQRLLFIKFNHHEGNKRNVFYSK